MQKTNIMRKHMNMKHADNQCKICVKVFTNLMDALVHTAKHNSQNKTEDNPKINNPLKKKKVMKYLDSKAKKKSSLCLVTRTALPQRLHCTLSVDM